MLENLCIDLLHELFESKYNLLISLQTNLHTKRKIKKEKKKKRDNIFRYLFIRVLEKDEYYTHFGYIKKKKIMKKKKIKKEYKKLRKHIADINAYYEKKNYSKSLKNEYNDTYCTTFNEYHTHTLLKSFMYNPEKIYFILRKKWNISIQNKIVNYKHKINDNKKRKRSICIYYCRRNRGRKKQKHNYKNYKLFTKNKNNNDIFNESKNINEDRNNDICLQFQKNNLYVYLDKYFYSILPNLDFKQLKQEKENLEQNNNLNYILNIEKMKNNLIKKKKIISKVYIKNKKHIYLSSTKLKKQYINFLDNFHLLIKKMKTHKERGVEIISSTNLKLLKTILYLENDYNDIDSINSNNSNDIIKNVLTKKKNYKIYHVISIINYIKKSLYIIKMDIMYIFIFFTSYINNIFAKLKNS